MQTPKFRDIPSNLEVLPLILLVSPHLLEFWGILANTFLESLGQNLYNTTYIAVLQRRLKMD